MRARTTWMCILPLGREWAALVNRPSAQREAAPGRRSRAVARLADR
jgi:hypothetical protein